MVRHIILKSDRSNFKLKFETLVISSQSQQLESYITRIERSPSKSPQLVSSVYRLLQTVVKRRGKATLW